MAEAPRGREPGPVRLYYRPGCSSCAKVKELLSSWGVELDPVDVEADPAALAAMRALGASVVPAVAVGRRVACGWSPSAYAELLGIEYEAAAKLPPAELAARLDRILACAGRLVATVPEPYLEHKAPGRDRTLRELAYHVFRVSLAFADGMDVGRLPAGWLEDKAPPDLRDGAAVARYGALVRGRLGGWFEGAAAGEYARVIDGHGGPQSGHELLERTTWHAAQHLRQIHALVEELGIAPPPPLPAADFDGLPLPTSLW
jgi:glutaredoxin